MVMNDDKVFTISALPAFFYFPAKYENVIIFALRFEHREGTPVLRFQATKHLDLS